MGPPGACCAARPEGFRARAAFAQLSGPTFILPPRSFRLNSHKKNASVAHGPTGDDKERSLRRATTVSPVQFRWITVAREVGNSPVSTALEYSSPPPEKS